MQPDRETEFEMLMTSKNLELAEVTFQSYVSVVQPSHCICEVHIASCFSHGMASQLNTHRGAVTTSVHLMYD